MLAVSPMPFVHCTIVSKESGQSICQHEWAQRCPCPQSSEHGSYHGDTEGLTVLLLPFASDDRQIQKLAQSDGVVIIE